MAYSNEGCNKALKGLCCGTKRSAFLAICTIFLLFGTANLFSMGASQSEEVEKQDSGDSVVDRIGKLIEDGKLEDAKKLFVAENVYNAVDANGQNVLHKAAKAKSSEAADFFIRLGTYVDAVDNSGDTPLNISQEFLDAQTAQVFVNSKASIHHRSSTGQTPVDAALINGDNSFLRSLINDDSVLTVDSEGKTILHLAADNGTPTAVRIVLTTPSRSVIQRIINIKTIKGKTALDFAFMHKDSVPYAESAVALIEAGGISSDRFYNYVAPAVRALNFDMHASDGNAPLHFSVKEQYTGWTRYLLDHNADANIKNTAGTTPLHEAVRIGDLETMRLLISRNANVNIQDGQGNSALHIAVPDQFHRQAIEMLLAAGANPNLRDGNGETPLFIVIRLNRSADIITTLLRGGADVTVHNRDGKTPLYVAVETNRVSLIPVLLQYKSDIFAATNAGKTPFELALSENSEALDALITEATVLQSDNGGNTPLLVAAKLGVNVELVRRILDRSALVNARNGEGDTALHIAIRMNEAQTGDLLLSRGADVFAQNAKSESPVFLTFYAPGGIRQWMFIPSVLQARDGLGNTVLHYVTEWKLDRAIALLASKGASLEAPNVTGETPLFIAVKINSASTVNALLNAGALINGRDTIGNTALHAAVRWNAQAAAEALINAKVDINAYNQNGKTPLHDSIRLGIFDIENPLVRRGASLEVRDKEGNRPLMEAVLVGSYRSVKHLIDSKADVSARNNFGETPLLIAVENERSDIVAELLDAGAKI
ncbi:MAG: ankyrin repeat domain-containing protein, partial [Spirochaetaceae bacterium]|nr:ankyrin repeat domain-containing protein [Spirochaetaceae bacterium]